MSCRTTFALTFASVICAFNVLAQSNIGNEQIDVVKAYQPMLSDAVKISDVPQSDTIVNYVPDMQYEHPKVRFNTVYTITPIKAVKVKDDNIKKLYRGFVKAGYGTENTPILEAYYNSLRSKEYDAGAHLNYRSSSGKAGKWEGYPGMSETHIGIFGSRFFSANTISGNIDFERNSYHYYGYDDTYYEKAEVRHRFYDISGSLMLGSNLENGMDTRYQAKLEFGNFSDNREHKEGRMIFDGNIITKLNEYDAGGIVVADISNYAGPQLESNSRNLYKIQPRVYRQFGRMKLTGGINMPIDANEKTNYYLFPHIRLDMNVAKETISAYAQISGDVERNSYRILSQENPFIGNNAGPILLNRRNNLDLQGGLNIKIENQLAFIGTFALTRIKDDAFFDNYQNIELTADSTIFRERTEYNVIYDDNTRLRLHAEIVYDQNEKTGFSIAVDYESNKTDNLEKPLFRPNFSISAKGHYNIGEKIYTKVSLAWVDSRYYRTQDASGNLTYESLDGYLDLSLGVDYRVSKLLSTFIQINNATASKYSRWYNYPSYRFGIFAGATYAF
jgi:hypothetical protein